MTPTQDDSRSETSFFPPPSIKTSGDKSSQAFEIYPTRPNTHNVRFAHARIPTIEIFANDLQGAIDGAYPVVVRGPYKNVYVLLLSWEDGQAGTRADVQKLQYVFATLYRFDVEECRVASKAAGDAMRVVVQSFLQRNDVEGNLLIVYYAGGARMSGTVESVIWTA